MSEIESRSDDDIAKLQAELGAKPESGQNTENKDAGGEYIPSPEQPQQQGPNATEQLAGAVAMMVQVGTTFLAARMGEHWQASEQEAQMMGAAYAEAIEYYYPDAEVGPGVAAVMVTGMYAIPRLAVQKKKEGETSGDQSK